MKKNPVSLSLIVATLMISNSLAQDPDKNPSLPSYSSRLEANYRISKTQLQIAKGSIVDMAVIGGGVGLVLVGKSITEEPEDVSRLKRIVGFSEAIRLQNRELIVESLIRYETHYWKLLKNFEATVFAIDPEGSASILENIQRFQVEEIQFFARAKANILNSRTSQDLLTAVDDFNKTNFRIPDELLEPIRKMKNAPAAKKAIDQFTLAYETFKTMKVFPSDRVTLENIRHAGNIIATADGNPLVAGKITPLEKLIGRTLKRAGWGMGALGVLDLYARIYELRSQDPFNLHPFPVLHYTNEWILGESDPNEQARVDDRSLKEEVVVLSSKASSVTTHAPGAK